MRKGYRIWPIASRRKLYMPRDELSLLEGDAQKLLAPVHDDIVFSPSVGSGPHGLVERALSLASTTSGSRVSSAPPQSSSGPYSRPLRQYVWHSRAYLPARSRVRLLSNHPASIDPFAHNPRRIGRIVRRAKRRTTSPDSIVRRDLCRLSHALLPRGQHEDAKGLRLLTTLRLRRTTMPLDRHLLPALALSLFASAAPRLGFNR